MSPRFFLPLPSESLHLTRSFIAAETKQRFRFKPFVYAEIGGILLPHTNTLFRGYLSINCLRYLSLFISSMPFLIFANIGTFW